MNYKHFSLFVFLSRNLLDVYFFDIIVSNADSQKTEQSMLFFRVSLLPLLLLNYLEIQKNLLGSLAGFVLNTCVQFDSL